MKSILEQILANFALCVLNSDPSFVRKREGTYGPVNKIGISCMFAQHLHLHPVAGL